MSYIEFKFIRSLISVLIRLLEFKSLFFIAMDENYSLNPKDFITFKTELDLLCDDEVDVFKRWEILQSIQKTQVIYKLVLIVLI